MKPTSICTVIGYHLEPKEGYSLPNGATTEYRMRTYRESFSEIRRGAGKYWTRIVVYLTSHDAIVETGFASDTREESRRLALAAVPRIVREELARREARAAVDPLYAAAKGIYS